MLTKTLNDFFWNKNLKNNFLKLFWTAETIELLKQLRISLALALKEFFLFLPLWWLSVGTTTYCALDLCESLLSGAKPKVQDKSSRAQPSQRGYFCFFLHNYLLIFYFDGKVKYLIDNWQLIIDNFCWH